MNYEFETEEHKRKNTDLNTSDAEGHVNGSGITVKENREYHNILGITGDVLTPEQVAEIDAAVSSLTPEQQTRVKEIVAAWLTTHHGMGLPNVKELAKAVKQGSLI